MQRYRVNYTLLISLLVGAVLLGGGIFGVLRWQALNNAKKWLAKADQAEAEGDLLTAIQSLYNYTRLKRDDLAAAERRTWLCVEYSKSDDLEPSQWNIGIDTIEQYLRRDSDHIELRRELVDQLMAGRRYKDALNHVVFLLKRQPDDGELAAMRLQCLVGTGKLKKAIEVGYQLVGYDPIADEWDRDQAKTPNTAGVHLRLASALRQDRGDPELAAAILDKLVEDNPDDAEAYLARGQYLRSVDREEQAGADIAKALELAPDNPDALLTQALVLLAAARQEADDEPKQQALRDEAYGLLSRAADAGATDLRVYQQLADMEARNDDVQAAIEQYDRGIRAVPVRQALQLAFYKAKLQVESGEVEDAEAAIAALEERGVAKEYADYLRARRLFAAEKWFKAAEELARIRPVLSKDYQISLEANLTLGICYEQLGQRERALEAYRQVTQRAPRNAFATAAVARLERGLGLQADDDPGTRLGARIQAELDKPESEQRWDEIDKAIDELLADNPLVRPESGDLMRVRVLLFRKKYDQAQRLIAEAINRYPDSLAVWRSAIQVIATNPDKGPAEALRRMDVVTKEFGDTPALRLDRADLLMQVGGEDVSGKLMALAEGMDDWSTKERVAMWKGLATRFQQLRDNEARAVALERVADLDPDALPTRLDLFEQAIERGDSEEVAAAQQAILDIVGSTSDPTYLFTEARRLVWQVGQGELGTDALDEADTLLERAMTGRQDWHRLYRLQGYIALARGQQDRALAALQEAAKRGPSNPRQVLVQVSLLLRKGRYKEAAEVLDSLSIGARQQLLGRTYPEILYNTGRVEEALASAQAVAESAADNAAMQLWYGRFLLRAAGRADASETASDAIPVGGGVSEQADRALSRAVELAPNNPLGWLARVELKIRQRKAGEAEQVLRAAQLSLPEDLQDPLLARAYEWLGRWFDAETVYRRLHERAPDNPVYTQQLASFYLSRRYPNDDGEQKATPLINSLLRAAADAAEAAESAAPAGADDLSEGVAAGDDDPIDDDTGPTEPANPGRWAAAVAWARRTAAAILADKRDYQKLLVAQELLEANAAGGALAEQDKLLMARILGLRPEPASRVKAIALFEDIKRKRALSPANDLRLGNLYYATGQPQQAKDQMNGVIARSLGTPAEAAARVSYIRMLLEMGQRADLQEASRQIKRLQRIAPQATETLELLVRTAVKLGEQKQASAAIAKLLPKDPDQAGVGRLAIIARLLTELGDYDRAERAYQSAAERDPKAGLLLAEFVGLHRDADRAFDLLEGMSGKINPAVVIRYGLRVLSARRGEAGSAYDDRVRALLDRALREDPESITLQLQLAQLLSIQKNYPRAIETYKRVLRLPELSGQPRALTLNNLGYLMAITSESQSVAREAMGYVTEAISILGPQADLLDTRAVVHTTLRDYAAAKKDIELALTENPTASKYFHKARALMLSGEPREASDAWTRAVELGLSRDSVDAAERQQFDDLQRRIDRLAAQGRG